MFESTPPGRRNPDKRESWNNSQLVFLGGFWESAGGMGISRAQGRKERWEYQPYMNYGANDRALIEALIGVYGGTFVSGTNSWEWQIAGEEAINLAGVMTEAQVSVYREKYFRALSEFGQSVDEVEKERIYRSVMEYNRSRVYRYPNEYKAWMERPEFVAGVVQATASVYWVKHQGRSSVYPNAKIISKNEPLLTALGNKFGGRIEGTDFGGKMLVLNAAQTRAMLDFSGDYLIYRDRVVTGIIG